MNAWLRSLLLLVLVGQLAACAGTQSPARLEFGIAKVSGGHRLMWPAAPEIPRYQYAGELVGEQNFVRDRENDSGMTRFLRWLTGLGQEAMPNVLQRPQAIAGTADGRIMVTDVSRGAVFVFDPVAGELNVWEYASGLTRFAAPIGIVATADGGAWVADADLGLIAHVDASGQPQATIGKGLLKRPTGLALDPKTGELYVADTYQHAVLVFAADGRWLRTIGGRGDTPGQFNYPTHIAIAGDRLYVTDTMNSRVQILPLSGEGAVQVVGERGLYLGNLVRPKGVASDSEGNVYVVESYYDRLLVFNAEGEFLMPIGGAGQTVGRFYLPAGVWVDAHDRVFVADTFNGRVVVFRYLGGSRAEAG